jgi:hypothetical protein
VPPRALPKPRYRAGEEPHAPTVLGCRPSVAARLRASRSISAYNRSSNSQAHTHTHTHTGLADAGVDDQPLSYLPREHRRESVGPAL